MTFFGKVGVLRAHGRDHGALRFVDEWGREAYRLRWTVNDIFELHPDAPAARYDCRGLAWLLGDGSQVVAIDDAGAETGTPQGGMQSYRMRL